MLETPPGAFTGHLSPRRGLKREDGLKDFERRCRRGARWSSRVRHLRGFFPEARPTPPHPTPASAQRSWPSSSHSHKGLGASPRRGQHRPMEAAASAQTLDFPSGGGGGWGWGEEGGRGAQHTGSLLFNFCTSFLPLPSLSMKLRLEISPQFLSPCPLCPLSQPCCGVFSTSAQLSPFRDINLVPPIFLSFFLGSYFPISSASLLFISSHCITPTLLPPGPHSWLPT